MYLQVIVHTLGVGLQVELWEGNCQDLKNNVCHVERLLKILKVQSVCSDLEKRIVQAEFYLTDVLQNTVM